MDPNVFAGWPLSASFPQIQTSYGTPPNLAHASMTLLAMRQALANGDPSVAMVAQNDALGILAGAQFAANGAAGILQSVVPPLAWGLSRVDMPSQGAASTHLQVGALSNGPANDPHKPLAEGEDEISGEKHAHHENDAGKDPRKRPRSAGAESQRAAEEGEMDITTPWRCDVCNLYFTSAQALGGHRINSTDHKQRCEQSRRSDPAALPATPRLSMHVYSNEEPAERVKRTPLPPMARMNGFNRVLKGFPTDVRLALAKAQGPASYFSSCSLDLFKRHEKFGRLGALIIDRHFTAPSEAFEAMMQDPRAMPEVEEAGFGLGSHMPEDVNDELQVYARMLQTKKRFLDVNRRAVSKRSKGIRKAGGLLERFNLKHARRARQESEPASEDGPAAAAAFAAARGTGAAMETPEPPSQAEPDSTQAPLGQPPHSEPEAGAEADRHEVSATGTAPDSESGRDGGPGRGPARGGSGEESRDLPVATQARGTPPPSQAQPEGDSEAAGVPPEAAEAASAVVTEDRDSAAGSHPPTRSQPEAAGAPTLAAEAAEAAEAAGQS